MPNLKLYILEDGTRLVGKPETVVEDAHAVDVISNPVMLIPDAQGRVQMAPYIHFCTETCVPINELTIRHTLTPIKEIVDTWDKQYGTGIITPSSTILK